MLADKGYDADGIIMAVLERGMQPVIDSKSNRTTHYYDFDRELYRERYRVERLLRRIRRFPGGRHALREERNRVI